MVLTMMVSLEAIFLVDLRAHQPNRFSDAADRRAELDLQIGLLAEHEITRVLQMLDAIQDKLGIENDVDSELADLEMETNPKTSGQRLTACTAGSKADVSTSSEGTPLCLNPTTTSVVDSITLPPDSLLRIPRTSISGSAYVPPSDRR